MSDLHGSIPESVELVYRAVGNTHVFSSKGISGLLHVGSCDREKAFNELIPSLNSHISLAYGCEVGYRLNVTYEDFCAHADSSEDIFGNFLHVTLDNKAAVSH